MLPPHYQETLLLLPHSLLILILIQFFFNSLPPRLAAERLEARLAPEHLCCPGLHLS